VHNAVHDFTALYCAGKNIINMIGFVPQEENGWLRSVLRLAEAHIKHEKEELRSLQVRTPTGEQHRSWSPIHGF
jgi:hypothetical protein